PRGRVILIRRSAGRLAEAAVRRHPPTRPSAERHRYLDGPRAPGTQLEFPDEVVAGYAGRRWRYLHPGLGGELAVGVRVREHRRVRSLPPSNVARPVTSRILDLEEVGEVGRHRQP